MSAETRFLTAAEIHSRISWMQILPQLGAADTFLRDRHGPCPVCGGTDRFRWDNEDERGTFICSKCGAGDGFRLVQLLHGCDFATARKMVMEAAGLSDEESAVQPIQPQRTTAKPDKLEWSPTAEAIWRKTQGLRGTLGETYLLSRNCMLPPKDSHLRYLPPDGNYPPSLCAGVTDAITGKPLSLHFTRLAADGCGKAGTDQDRLLLKGHRKAGGVVRLWPDEAVTTSLGLAEGIESALAAAHGFTPVWAAIDANNMAAFPVLAGIQSLTLFIDHDAAGIRAGMACAERWSRRVEVRKVMSEVPGEDFCDVVNAA
jgi:putative DNA primase/helicase